MISRRPAPTPSVTFFGLFKPVDRALSWSLRASAWSGAPSARSVSFGSHRPASVRWRSSERIPADRVLIFRSTSLPGFLGVLMMFGGLGWLTFVSPTLAGHLKPFDFIPGILGELVLTVWLLVKGWTSRAGGPRPARMASD